MMRKDVDRRGCLLKYAFIHCTYEAEFENDCIKSMSP